MHSKTSKISLITGGLLIILGLAGSLPYMYYQWTNQGSAPNNHTQVLRNQPITPVSTMVSGEPVSITIPSLNINLPVIDGYYNKTSGQWTLTLNKAQFATPSVLPNNSSGNTLIYGHYRPEVFAYLHLIKPGSQAIVTTANGYSFIYTYQSSYAVNPADTSIFSYQGPPMLTVQTCSGAWFQNRQLYQFRFDTYSKAV